AMQELAFYHNCRDLNPAALITSLQSEFSDPGNVHLVAEMSMTHQVWNFPLWGYQVDLDAPKLISQIPLPRRLNYAPQTMYVVPAKIFLDYATAVNPLIAYRDQMGDPEADFDLARRAAYNVE